MRQQGQLVPVAFFKPDAKLTSIPDTSGASAWLRRISCESPDADLFGGIGRLCRGKGRGANPQADAGASLPRRAPARRQDRARRHPSPQLSDRLGTQPPIFPPASRLENSRFLIPPDAPRNLARTSCRRSRGASSMTGWPCSTTRSCSWRSSRTRPASSEPSAVPRTGLRPGSRETSPTTVRGCIANERQKLAFLRPQSDPSCGAGPRTAAAKLGGGGPGTGMNPGGGMQVTSFPKESAPNLSTATFPVRF